MSEEDRLRVGKLLTLEEYNALNDEGVAKGHYRDDPRIVAPGTGWLLPCWYDPTGERESAGKRVMIRAAQFGRSDLSAHYWRDHADTRPPIMIMGPDGSTFCPDQPSANNDGAGWRVTGTWPHISISPSIVLQGWHGYVVDGAFSHDYDGRGQHGRMRELSMRADHAP